MIFLRELAKKLKVSEIWIKKNVYVNNNILRKADLEKIKDFFENKNTNNGLIKAKKIEELLKKINEVA